MPELMNRTAAKQQKSLDILESLKARSMVLPSGPAYFTRSHISALLGSNEISSWMNGMGLPSDMVKAIPFGQRCAMVADEAVMTRELLKNGFEGSSISILLRENRRDLLNVFGRDWLDARLALGGTIKINHFLATGNLSGIATEDLGPAVPDAGSWIINGYGYPPKPAPDGPFSPVPDVTPTKPNEDAMQPNATPDPLTALLAQSLVPILRDELRKEDGDLTEGRVLALIDEQIKTRVPFVIHKPSPRPEDGPIPEVVHEALPQVLTAVNCGLNVMLIGPAGSGKTSVAEQIAERIKVPFRFTGAVDSPYKLTGFVDATGRVVRTAFREAYENGGLFLFDEVDASSPSALMAFNAALANGVADFPDGKVERHPNFFCIAAANTFGRGADRIYVGRNSLDGATLDRFVVVDFDYDEAMERAIAGQDMAKWVDYVQRIRRAVFSLKLRFVVSPRASIFGGKLLRAGMSRSIVEEMVIWKGMEKESREKVRKEAKI